MINYKHNPKLTKTAQKLRKEMTEEERHLWYDFLREYPVRFLRQKVIDDYIVDFYCSKAKLILELDGSQHYEDNKQIRYDQIRTTRLQGRDLVVLRIPNLYVSKHFEGICEYIDMIVRSRCPQEFKDKKSPL